jgi:hypothetical protein
LFQTAFGPDGRSAPRRNCPESRVPSHSVLDDCRLMIVEPYDLGFPFQIVVFELRAIKECNCVPNASHTRQNRPSVLFSTKKARQVQNEKFSSRRFEAMDLTIMSRSSLRLEFSRSLCMYGVRAQQWVRVVEKRVLIWWRLRGEYERCS